MRISGYFFAFGIFLCLVSLLYGFTDIRAINYADPDVTATFANINHNDDVINVCIELITLGVLSISAAALIIYFERKSHRTYLVKFSLDKIRSSRRIKTESKNGRNRY